MTQLQKNERAATTKTDLHHIVKQKIVFLLLYSADDIGEAKQKQTNQS